MEAQVKVNFYLLGEKGFVSLKSFLSEFGNESVAYVIAARDKGISNDYFDNIEELCRVNDVAFQDRAKLSVSVDSQLFSFSIGWRWMIEATERLIVFHDSLLPKYRGFSPLVNALINKEDKIGVTALVATSEYDKGNILAQEAVGVLYPINIQQAIELITPIYVKLVLKVYSTLLSGSKLVGTKQDETNATYSLWRDESDYFVDWGKSAVDIKRFCDAVGSPFKGACTRADNRIIRLNHVKIFPDVQVESRTDHIGKIIFMNKNNPVIVCGSGLLEIITYQCDDDDDAIVNQLKFRTRFL